MARQEQREASSSRGDASGLSPPISFFGSSMHKCMFIPFMLPQPYQIRATFYHSRVYACYRSEGLLAHGESSDEEQLAGDVEEGGEEGEGVDCVISLKSERASSVCEA